MRGRGGESGAQATLPGPRLCARSLRNGRPSVAYMEVICWPRDRRLAVRPCGDRGVKSRDIVAVGPDGRRARYRVYPELVPPLGVDCRRALKEIRLAGLVRVEAPREPPNTPGEWKLRVGGSMIPRALGYRQVSRQLTTSSYRASRTRTPARGFQRFRDREQRVSSAAHARSRWNGHLRAGPFGVG